MYVGPSCPNPSSSRDGGNQDAREMWEILADNLRRTDCSAYLLEKVMPERKVWMTLRWVLKKRCLLIGKGNGHGEELLEAIHLSGKIKKGHSRRSLEDKNSSLRLETEHASCTNSARKGIRDVCLFISSPLPSPK
jgi:hypothetical protein